MNWLLIIIVIVVVIVVVVVAVVVLVVEFDVVEKTFSALSSPDQIHIIYIE